MIDYIGPETKLVVRKRVQAAPALVFRAFTEAALIEQWFRPSADASVRVDMLEVREGGRYRFLYHYQEGARLDLKTSMGETPLVSPITRSATAKRSNARAPRAIARS